MIRHLTTQQRHGGAVSPTSLAVRQPRDALLPSFPATASRPWDRLTQPVAERPAGRKPPLCFLHSFAFSRPPFSRTADPAHPGAHRRVHRHPARRLHALRPRRRPRRGERPARPPLHRPNGRLPASAQREPPKPSCLSAGAPPLPPLPHSRAPLLGAIRGQAADGVRGLPLPRPRARLQHLRAVAPGDGPRAHRPQALRRLSGHRCGERAASCDGVAFRLLRPSAAPG